MLRMEPVQREILDKIEQTLRTEFMSNLARTSKRDSHEMMAEIFNNFDRQTESRFIAALEERNRESAERIRALMFVFEDLSKLDPGGVQTLLRAVEKDQLGLALKGASDSLREMFFSNMSERAAKIMREDMESMGPVRLKDVDAGPDGHGPGRQGPGRQGRDHAGRRRRRRRADLLMTAARTPQASPSTPSSTTTATCIAPPRAQARLHARGGRGRSAPTAYAEGERSRRRPGRAARRRRPCSQIAARPRQAPGRPGRASPTSTAPARAELALACAGKIADAALDHVPRGAGRRRAGGAGPRDRGRAAPGRPRRRRAGRARCRPRSTRPPQAIGFAGQIERQAPTPACRRAAFILDWGDGRAAFDPDAAADRVAEALDAALAAEGLHAEPVIPSRPRPS